MTPLDDVSLGDTSADPIRMSVLNAVLEISRYREAYPGSTVEEAARVLAEGFAAKTGHAYSEAAELLASIPGYRVPLSGGREAAIRSLLRELTVVRRPGWARLIPRGRRHLAAYLPRNALQCMQAAGLYDAELDDASLKWWDRLASYFRSASDLERILAGREGERLTLAAEKARLEAAGRSDLKPTWVSLDDNSLGYDVFSYSLDTAGRESPLHIEVKASAARPLRFFLTRNEWKIAKSLDDAFVLHLWDLTDRKVTQFSVSDLEPHVPTDHGWGTWQHVMVALP